MNITWIKNAEARGLRAAAAAQAHNPYRNPSLARAWKNGFAFAIAEQRRQENALRDALSAYDFDEPDLDEPVTRMFGRWVGQEVCQKLARRGLIPVGADGYHGLTSTAENLSLTHRLAMIGHPHLSLQQ